MERKQGFFSALKDDVFRGFSPARSGSSRPGLLWTRRRRRSIINSSSHFVSRSTLTPLMEGPDPDGEEPKRVASGFCHWVKGQLTRTPSVSDLDLRLLMGAPLAPVHVSTSDPLPLLTINDIIPIQTSSAQYILQQYIAASGGQKKLQNYSVKNATYARGKLKMLCYEIQTFPTTKTVKKSRNGGFVIWQMNPNMWFMELAIGGTQIHAGCNGKIMWRQTPWLGALPAKGPVRPLRRALQGLDPKTTATMFANARIIGEKNINGDDCFILKLSSDPQTLKSRTEGLSSAEIIRHVLFGYFSQKSGLLVHIQDSQLTRIESNGEDPVYWETTISSFLDDYRPVEGIMIAHSGRSTVTLFRFGDTAVSHAKTSMEEAWTIEEVGFNIPGLSLDCFIPPADLRQSTSLNQSFQLPQNESDDKNSIAIAAHCDMMAVLIM